MAKRINITLEAFGGRCLTAMYTAEQLNGKKLKDVVEEMISRPWEEPEQRHIRSLICKEMEASRGYVPTVGTGGLKSGEPVRFQPVKLGDPISKYTHVELPDDTLRISVNGDHEVGVGNGYRTSEY